VAPHSDEVARDLSPQLKLTEGWQYKNVALTPAFWDESICSLSWRALLSSRVLSIGWFSLAVRAEKPLRSKLHSGSLREETMYRLPQARFIFFQIGLVILLDCRGGWCVLSSSQPYHFFERYVVFPGGAV